MTLPITFFMVLFCHFVGDFALQSRWMAEEKSKNVEVLLLHSIIYSFPFIFFGLTFAIINGCLHFLVDLITSKLTSFFWKQNDTHSFFMVIGLDQMTHTCFLITTSLLFL